MPAVIEIPCPSCEQALKVPETIFGKKIKCKHCGHPFVARDPDGEAVQVREVGQERHPVQARRARGVKVKKEEPKPAPPPPPKKHTYDDDDEDEEARNPTR